MYFEGMDLQYINALNCESILRRINVIIYNPTINNGTPIDFLQLYTIRDYILNNFYS